jgi:lipid-binding SYLF domain-containing protein
MIDRTHLSRPRVSFCIFLIGLGAMLVTIAASGAMAEDATDEKELVERARITFESFVADDNMVAFREYVKDARGVFIVPQLFKAGFMVGGSGGGGILLARDEKPGNGVLRLFTRSRSKGVYGGLTLEGAVIAARDSYNSAYYGKQTRSIDILLRHTVSNDHSAPLQNMVAKAAR